jgi:hypothetical protein
MQFDINLTIIVQAINFLVAYWLLNTLLLKHGVALVQARDDELHTLEHTVSTRRTELQVRQELIHNQWQAFKNLLGKQQPIFKHGLRKPLQTTEHLLNEPLPPESVIQNAVHQITTKIMDKVVHDEHRHGL